MSSCSATCTMSHGGVTAASQQIVVGVVSAFQVVPPYLIRVTPDEVDVFIDEREVTMLMGSGGPSYG